MRIKKALADRRAVVVLALLILWAGWAGYSYSRGSVRFLYCRLAFSRALSADSPELEKQSHSGQSNVYYFTSYYLNGMLSAVEGTGDERLLKRTMRVLDAMIASSREFPAGGRTYRVWGPFTINADSPVPRPILHYTFQAAVPFARAAAVIRANPRFRLRHEAAARRYVEFTDQLVVQYFYRRELNSSIPWLDPDRFPIWNDNASNLALTAAFLCQAGGDPEHCGIATAVGRAFKTKISPYRDGWIWENQTIPIGSDTDNTPGSVGNQAGVPDTSHTNREAFLVMTLAEMGLLFSQADVERMAGTLTDTLWNKSLENPMFSNYLNGSDKPYRVYKLPGLNGSIYHGWSLLGGYSPRAQEAMIATLKAIVLRRKNPSLERNATSYGGTVALAGHILRNFNAPGLKPLPAEERAGHRMTAITPLRRLPAASLIR